MIEHLTKEELKHIAWRQLGVRVSPQATSEEIHDLLQYRKDESELPPNPVNELRDTLIEFIETNRENLSLPCSGNCYTHEDGLVVFCYRQFKEDTNA